MDYNTRLTHMDANTAIARVGIGASNHRTFLPVYAGSSYERLVEFLGNVFILFNGISLR